MSNDTQFKPGYDPRRKGAGRPAGAKNKMESKMLESVLKRADNFSPEAFNLLKQIARGEVKGQSVNNQLTAILKTFELSLKYQEELENIIGKANAKDLPKDDAINTPLISLSSEPSSKTSH